MSLPQLFPAIPIHTAHQIAAPRDSATEAQDIGPPPKPATQPWIPESNASKIGAPLRAIKKRPSLSQVLGRARAISGSSSGSDDPRPFKTIRPVKSLKFFANQPSTSHSEEEITRAKGQNRRDLAPWDRTVDFVYHQYPRGTSRPDKVLDYERSVNLLLREHGRQQNPTRSGYFALPAAFRFKIWEYVIDTDPNDKPVALTIPRWNKDVWREDEFSTLSEAIDPIQPCLSVSFEFRTDALVAFLMTRRFHVTYSPCVYPGLNPLATKWLEKYGPYIQDIALEVVLTEFRFGMSPSAHLLDPAMTRLETLIGDFVRTQTKRRSASTLNSLVILCRRFYGRRRANARPQSWEGTADDGIYCPNNYLTALDPLRELCGLADSVRMCGLSQPYTFSLAQSLFLMPAEGKLRLHSYNVTPSTVWPQLAGQEAQVDTGDGRLRVQKHTEAPPGTDGGPWGAVQLPAPAGNGKVECWLEKQMWLRRVSVRR